MRLAVEGGGAQVQVQSALLGFVIAGALQEHLDALAMSRDQAPVRALAAGPAVALSSDVPVVLPALDADDRLDHAAVSGRSG
jgi:hypothetical protein